MKRIEKETLVAEMADRLKKARATFLVNYQGLDVAAMNALRKELKKAQTDLQVVKNRLLRLASENTDTASLREFFVGPCAVAITYEDVIAPAKVLVDQEKKLERLELKAGQISGKAMDFGGIKRLAELPGKDVLLAQLLSTMQGVPTSLVRALNGIVLNLIFALKAIESQKGESGI